MHTLRRLLSVVSALTFVAAGCSSSSSSSSSANGGVNAASVSNVAGTFNALEGLLFDGSSAPAKLTPRSVALGPVVGSFSYMGCHYVSDRDRMFSNVDRIRDPLCHISIAESSGLGFSIGDNAYNYFNITGMKEGANAPVAGTSFKIRIGQFANSDGQKCLRYQACNQGTVQSESFEVCNISDGVTASIQNKFDDSGNTGQSSTDLTAHADIDGALTSADISNQFIWNNGSGSAKLTGDKVKKENTFVGHFQNTFTDPQKGTFDNDSGVCVDAGGGTGSGKIAGTYQFPAFSPDGGINYYCPSGPGANLPPQSVAQGTSCSNSFSQIESFSIDSSVTPPAATVIADADSPWFTATEACVIPTAADAPVDFSVAWDCAAPSGFTEIDGSAIDFSSCDKFKGGQGGNDSCDAQRNAALPKP